jgi:2-polyprenyl-3-methyl-5-hydroxy-6-metoxy-1,4-benzoquinol methylase
LKKLLDMKLEKRISKVKRTNNLNVNTKYYWDDVYGTVSKRDEYNIESGDMDHPMNVGDKFIYPSRRFNTAVEQVKEGDKVLDIGCGTGKFVEKVINKYPFNEVWGIDLSSVVIEDNKLRVPEIVFIQQRIGALDKVPENYFDIVFSGEVIEHLEDPMMLFKDAYNCLKVGGRFITTTPREKSVNSNEHIWYISDDDVKGFYKDAGFINLQHIQLPELEKHMIIFTIGEKSA